MWFLMALLFVGWVLSVHFYLPAWLSILLLVGIVAALTLLLMPSQAKSSTYVYQLRDL